jgi:hypothetical protein
VKSFCEEGAATMDSNQRGCILARVALDDLVSDARQRPPDLVLSEDDLLVCVHRFLPGLTGPG